jgi:hypothetical protein
MDGQLLAAAILIGVAGAYLLVRGWRTWRGLKGGDCAGGCGCAKTTPGNEKTGGVLIPSEQITLRKRPGIGDS